MNELLQFDKGISPDELRARVIAFELEQMKKPQVEIRVIHHFAHNVCLREVHIPAGTDVTGMIHKYANANILSQGEMLVTTENGIEHVKAPFTVVSPAGTKRAATTLTDCVWTSVLGTSETDIEKIEQIFTAKSEQEYLEFSGILALEGK